MNPLIQLKQTSSVFLVAFGLACFGLSPASRAVVPAPDGGYPGANTAEGQKALFSLATGGFNTAVGWLSLETNSTGQFNTGIGAGTLALNTANENTATGTGALLFNTTGTTNTASGALALFNNTNGSANTAAGVQSLFSNTSGNANTATGDLALLSNTTGSFNTANGFQALQNNTVDNNTAIGFAALFSNTTGATNVAVGSQALLNNTTGSFNNATGFDALANLTGNHNNAYGWKALHGNTTGCCNVAIGSQALINGTSASGNVVIGDSAGSLIITHNNIIAIGEGVTGVSSVFGEVDNSCYIGNIFGQPFDPATGILTVVDGDGKLGTVASSRRFKHDIKPMDKASETILALKPVTFHYKGDAKNTPCFGLIAEDVATVNPDLVVREKDGEPYSVRYDQVNAMLLNEFLKEHHQVQDLRAIVAKQQKQIEALTAGLQKVSAQLEVSKPAPQTVLNNQ